MATTISGPTVTDDSGTPASPVGDGTLFDAAFFTSLYAAINAMWSGATHVFAGILTLDGFGTHLFQAGGTGGQALRIRNTTAGSGNFAQLEVGNDTGSIGTLIAWSSTHTESADIKQDGVSLRNTADGGVSLVASHASGDLRGYARGSTKLWTFDGEHFILTGQDTGTRALSSVLSDSVNTAQVGTDAATTEKDLHTYTLPASTLAIDGRGVRIHVAWTTSANANTKRFRVYFGSTVVFDSGALAENGRNGRITVDVFRTGAATQDAIGTAVGFSNAGAPLDGTFATPTETLSGAVVIKTTGQNGTATATDCRVELSYVELLN